MMQIQIIIAPVIGGFVVTYPKTNAGGDTEYVQEVATTSGKALRIARVVAEAFSLVAKPKDEADEV